MLIRQLKSLLFGSKPQPSDLSYLSLIEITSGSISFLLHFHDHTETEKMILEIIRLEHDRLIQVQATRQSDNVLVRISYPKTEFDRFLSLLDLIVEKEREIKDDGKSSCAA